MPANELCLHSYCVEMLKPKRLSFQRAAYGDINLIQEDKGVVVFYFGDQLELQVPRLRLGEMSNGEFPLK